MKKEITNKELHEKLINIGSIEQQIYDYTVALGRYIVNGKRYHAELIGSGTLIQIAGKYGILTAQHVIPKLIKSGTFLISIASYRHRFEVDRNHIDVIELQKPSKNAERPDLAFVLLLGHELTTIQAKKTFLSISYWKTKLTDVTESLDNSLWTISGHPAAYTKSEEPSARAIEAKCFRNVLGYTYVRRELIEGEFDYLETGICYKPGTNLPSHFGGVSGGGLWQIPITVSQNGEVYANDPILYGVAFRQMPIVNNNSKIICHGPDSIYRVLYDLVEQTYSS